MKKYQTFEILSIVFLVALVAAVGVISNANFKMPSRNLIIGFAVADVGPDDPDLTINPVFSYSDMVPARDKTTKFYKPSVDGYLINNELETADAFCEVQGMEFVKFAIDETYKNAQEITAGLENGVWKAHNCKYWDDCKTYVLAIYCK